MPRDHSTKPQRGKANKPYPDYPLTQHPNGQWCKRIRGKLYYFGTEPDAALELYKLQCDDLYAGRTPRRSPDDLTVEDICNLFLEAKRQLVLSGRLRQRTWRGYQLHCRHMCGIIGNLVAEHLTPVDFDRVYADIAQRCTTLKAIDSCCTHYRLPFTWAFKEARLIKAPPHFGSLLKRVSRREMRKDRARKRSQHGRMMYTPQEIHMLLIASPVHVQAMVWLAINCALGNADIGSLTLHDLDLDGRWLRLPRSKSGEERRCPLWPQTVAAIKRAVAVRPAATERRHDDLVFLTRRGGPWHDDESGIQSPLSQVFKRILEDVGLYRRGRNFYALRHTWQTIAENTTRNDKVAIGTIMGHADNTMAAEYREYVDDERLFACTDAVRNWLMVVPPGPCREAVDANHPSD
jgi:integrase